VDEKKIVDCFSISERRKKIDCDSISPNKTRQCQLLSIHRSGLYYSPRRTSHQQLALMNAIDKIHTDDPYYGTRRLKEILQQQGFTVSRKRISKLLARMGIEILYPKKRLSIPNSGHQIYPYLLRNRIVERVNEVWQTDFTYVKMKQGWMYLMAIIDVKSRYVLNWSISNTQDKRWCCDVLREAIAMYGAPEICNTDQGSQFTSRDFTGILKEHGTKISMNSVGRATDNAVIERLWRSVKYENIYPNLYQTGTELYAGLSKYFENYNTKRIHQSIGYRTPMQVFKNAF